MQIGLVVRSIIFFAATSLFAADEQQRFQFYQIGGSSNEVYLLDGRTGRVWQLARPAPQQGIGGPTLFPHMEPIGFKTVNGLFPMPEDTYLEVNQRFEIIRNQMPELAETVRIIAFQLMGVPPPSVNKPNVKSE